MNNRERTHAIIERFEDEFGGAGLDCKDIREGATVYRIDCSYHCMTEHGYYDGYAQFTVTIKKNELDPAQGFRLTFNDDYSRAKDREYMLRDYLTDSVYITLESIATDIDKENGS